MKPMINPGPHPNTFYRVSLKAVIRNEAGEVLVVRENGSSWSLPGGGLDHGEDPIAALARELYEEVGYEGMFSAEPIGVRTVYVEEKSAWLMWVIYDVTPETHTFRIGEDADEIAFMPLEQIGKGTSRSERMAYDFLKSRGPHEADLGG